MRHAITVMDPEKAKRAMAAIRGELRKIRPGRGGGGAVEEGVGGVGGAKGVGGMDGGGEGEGVQLDVFEMEAWGDPAPRLITVLPTRAGKGNAALYVLDKLGIPVEDAVCAGDTYGDEPILRTGIRCVCVGTCET